MAEIRESQIRALAGTVNGINKIFTTPTEYQAGSLRVIWNGQVYEPDDDVFGWTETGSNQITLTTAPKMDDVLQAYYRDYTAVEVDPEDVVVGSPFYPGELG